MLRIPLALQLLFLLLCLTLASCASVEPPHPTAPPDYMGYSGTVSHEAELLFSRARVLWRGSAASSATAPELCSNPAEAVALLDKAIALEPSYAEAYVRRGLAKSELGQKEEAFTDATTSIRLHPDAESYAFRALISMRGGNLRAAHKDLEYSLQLIPSQHLSWNLTGVLALMEGNTAGACESFAKACSAGDCGRNDVAKAEGLCK